MNYLTEYYKRKSTELQNELILLEKLNYLLENELYEEIFLLNEIVRTQGPPPTRWEELMQRIQSVFRPKRGTGSGAGSGATDEGLEAGSGRGIAGGRIIPPGNIHGKQFSKEAGGWPALFKDRYFWFDRESGKVFRWDPERGIWKPFEGTSPWGKTINGKPASRPDGKIPQNPQRPGGKPDYVDPQTVPAGIVPPVFGGGVGTGEYEVDDSIRPNQGWAGPAGMDPIGIE